MTAKEKNTKRITLISSRAKLIYRSKLWKKSWQAAIKEATRQLRKEGKL